MRLLPVAAAAASLLIPFAVSGADLNCTIKAAKSTKAAAMRAMAKFPEEKAKKTALDTVKAANARIAKGGLEVEDGCLVYSYDVVTPGKSGVDEVIIDAGNGKVLKTEREGGVRQPAQKLPDKIKK